MRQKTDQPEILVVEHDEQILASICGAIACKGYRIATCSDCSEALTRAAASRLKLVISDVDLRINTGVRLETLIHSIPGNDSVPFLYTSSAQVTDVISRRYRDRNAFYVRKPFREDVFASLVEFSMWRPQQIRSHIKKVHHQQGLSQPHVFLPPVQVAPAICPPAFGITPIQFS